MAEYNFQLDQMDQEPDPKNSQPGTLELYHNIKRKRHKISNYIKAFSKQKQNDGIFSENIVRLVIDGINLNHFHKNHPNVDIAAVNPIPGICLEEEIISIKSSINYTSLNTILRDTKAVKIESLFSYLLFAYNEYKDYTDSSVSPISLLNKALVIVSKQLDEDDEDEFNDYDKIVNIVTYHLMFHNEDFDMSKFILDIEKIANGSYKRQKLSYDFYKNYEITINKELEELKTPISLGIVYIEPKTKGTDNVKVVIRKCHPIPLNIYWKNLLKEWCRLKYFNVKGARGKVTKYLSFDSIREVFQLGTDVKDFPIKISISTGAYKYGYEIQDRKERTASKVNKLYVATKMRDADFQDKEKEIFNMINKEIDVLENDPNLVIKFNDFINKMNK